MFSYIHVPPSTIEECIAIGDRYWSGQNMRQDYRAAIECYLKAFELQQNEIHISQDTLFRIVSYLTNGYPFYKKQGGLNRDFDLAEQILLVLIKRNYPGAEKYYYGDYEVLKQMVCGNDYEAYPKPDEDSKEVTLSDRFLFWVMRRLSFKPIPLPNPRYI